MVSFVENHSSCPVTRQFYRWQRGERVCTNPLATIFAWSGALRKRGELDGSERLVSFADCLERAGLDVFEAGHFSEDLAMLCEEGDYVDKPDIQTMLALIRARLQELMI